MNGEYSVTMTTFADRESAKKTAKLLVERRLAACAQLFPIESIYMWKDEICDDNEVMLMVKSKAALNAEISNLIRETHPYELPEIIQVPIVDGLPEYFHWVDGCVKQY